MGDTGNGTSKVFSWKTQPPAASFPVTTKIFAVKGYFPVVKAALFRRGWIEKKHRFFHCSSAEPVMWPFKRDLRIVLPDTEKVQKIGENEDEIENKSDDSINNQDAQSSKLALLRCHPPTLLWASRRDAISYDHLHKSQIVNHFSHGGFTTKASLCTVVRNVSWTCDVDGNKIFPRCFCVANALETQAFIENFKLTSCFSVIKRVVKKAEEWLKIHPESKWFKIPEEVLKFALMHAGQFLSSKNHNDIEITDEKKECTNAEWIWFLGWSNRLKDNASIVTEWYCHLIQCHKLSKEIEEIWPQWNIDGDRNVWILKPAAKSRGQGIKICENLADILEHVENAKENNNTNYIIQKYIERPFLMQGTKFDIRQWFLVTDFNPLTMWMYKDSYLRFCSVPFTLDDKDASIHLCNNAIQCRYLKSASRLSSLPEGNMITNDEFKCILEERGYPDAWDNIIYPRMQSILISILQSAQDQMLGRKNCFELYGADFMIDEYLRPWLIEINSSPCLAPTTTVTKKLCARVVDDALKIVLDRRLDKKCDIGCFELVHLAVKLVPPIASTFRITLRGNKIDISDIAYEPPMQTWFYYMKENKEISKEHKNDNKEIVNFRNGSLWHSNLYSHNKSSFHRYENSNTTEAIEKMKYLNKKPAINSQADVKFLQNPKETLVLHTEISNHFEGLISQDNSPKIDKMQKPTSLSSPSKIEQNFEHPLKETKEMEKPLIMPKLEDTPKTQETVMKTPLQGQEKQSKNGRKCICPKSKCKKKGVNNRNIIYQRKKTIPKIPSSKHSEKSDVSCKEKGHIMSNTLNVSEKVTTKAHEFKKANISNDGYKDHAVSQSKPALIKATSVQGESHLQLKKKLEKIQFSKSPLNDQDDANKNKECTKPLIKSSNKLNRSSQQKKKILSKVESSGIENEFLTSQRTNSFSIKKAENDLPLNRKNKNDTICALAENPNISDTKDLGFSETFKCHTLPFAAAKHSIKNRS